MKRIIFFFLVILCFAGWAQDKSVMYKYSWKRRNLSVVKSYSGAIAAEMIEIPYEYYESTRSFLCVPYFSYAYETKMNIYNYKDFFSVSLNNPANVGFAICGDDPDGLGYITIPLILHFNYGYHSTYNNIDMRGFSFGLGYQLIVAPVIMWGDPGYGQLHSCPVVKGEYKWAKGEPKNERRKGGVLSLTVSINEVSYWRLGYGFTINY